MSERIRNLTMEGRAGRFSAEAEHERNVAMADLTAENVFEPVCMTDGPYDVHLKIEDGRLVLEITSAGGKEARVVLSVAPLRRVIRDYFMIFDSYHKALVSANPSKIEAIDMGRRGVHNEGSEQVQVLLQDRIKVDFATARRLFTLICVLHIK